jgi:hypothetical protein
MLKTFAAVLLATSIYSGFAAARGGGAETIPGTDYTDMPDYRPRPAKPRVWIKHVRKHDQWRRDSVNGN